MDGHPQSSGPDGLHLEEADTLVEEPLFSRLEHRPSHAFTVPVPKDTEHIGIRRPITMELERQESDVGIPIGHHDGRQRIDGGQIRLDGTFIAEPLGQSRENRFAPAGEACCRFVDFVGYPYQFAGLMA